MLAPQTGNARDTGAALIAEFQIALARVTSERRAKMLLALADLFVAIAGRIGEAEIAVFDQLLLDQLPITNHTTVVALSKKLAALPNAPPLIVDKFARDDSAAVAAPVLSSSPRLHTADLVRYAAMHGQDHMHAICARSEIPPALSAALIMRGGRSVIDRLAVTLGASFSVESFAYLLENATADERGRIKVHQRAAIEPNPGRGSVPCTVFNIAPHGAFMKPDGETSLPERFALVLPAVESLRIACRLVWKSGLGLGVAFESAPFA